MRKISPYEVPEIVTGDTRLLPFSDIAGIFEKMVLVKNAWVTQANNKNQSDDRYSLNVKSAKLGLMRIKTQNDTETGIVVPVWDFTGDAVWGNGEMDKDVPILTVNAVDGTVIDRALGF